jgi:hypothetical protein
MKILIAILSLLLTTQVLGQNSIFYKTTGKKHFHYIEFVGEHVIVYKMGFYIDKAGSGPAVLLTDTLIKSNGVEYKGKNYALIKSGQNYILRNDTFKGLYTEQENNIKKINTELNNAYCLKSYVDLSDKLNKEYPLNNYTFRNGYYAWRDKTNKSINHNDFKFQTDKEIKSLYDSISTKQNAFTKTTNFITSNAGQIIYSTLRDSIRTLPIDWRPNSGYFDKVVYQMAKSNPAYFYKLLQDFPTSKSFIYNAVKQDKELVKQLKAVQGYDDLKKEFFKEYKFGKNMVYRVVGTYIIVAGLITWLIVAQP